LILKVFREKLKREEEEIQERNLQEKKRMNFQEKGKEKPGWDS
jgi:hypothetical protein